MMKLSDRDKRLIKEYLLLQASCGFLGLETELDLCSLGPDNIDIETEEWSNGTVFKFYIPSTKKRFSISYTKETITNILSGKIDVGNVILRGLENIANEIDTTMTRLGQLEEIQENLKRRLEEIEGPQ